LGKKIEIFEGVKFNSSKQTAYFNTPLSSESDKSCVNRSFGGKTHRLAKPTLSGGRNRGINKSFKIKVRRTIMTMITLFKAFTSCYLSYC
jgi:hypothetical protein